MIAFQRYYARRFGKPVSRRLLGDCYRPPRDPLASRAELAARVAECAEAGQVAIVHGGRDCDGGAWENAVQIIPACAVAVARWDDVKGQWADGPYWFHIERPSVAAELEQTNRDLGLEAFEDGHPSVIYA